MNRPITRWEKLLENLILPLMLVVMVFFGGRFYQQVKTCVKTTRDNPVQCTYRVLNDHTGDDQP